MKARKTKKLRVVIILICLVVGVCSFVLLNANTKIELSKFTAQTVRAFGDTAETIISQWDISASSEDSVTATLYGDGRLVISGTGKMKTSVNEEWDTYKEEIKSLIVQDGVENITSSAFKECSNLESVELSENITSIPNYVFSDCSNLVSIGLPESITYMGDFAFYNCSKLTSINIPDEVDRIGAYAFNNCSSLLTINIPNNVTTIYQNAFSGCSSLTSINIPSKVTEIGRHIIEVNGTVTMDAQGVFSGCSSLESINVDSDNMKYSSIGGVLFDKEETTLKYYPEGKKDTKYSIPDDTTTIEYGVFNKCTNLISINVPSSVTDLGVSESTILMNLVGDSVFLRCNNLEEINVDAHNLKYSSIDGILFNKNKTKILRYPSSKNDINKYTLPSSVTDITNCAFAECNGLTNIEILQGTINIGNMAFFMSTNLGNIKIPESVSSIGNGAFAYCSSLKSIEIPEGVTIGDTAFWRCTGITSINLPEDMEIGENVFKEAQLTIEIEKVNSQAVMPEILSRGLEPNDVLYSETELELINCDWNENGETLKINGSTANVNIKEGPLAGLTVTMNIVESIETTPPTINSVTGNATEWTNQDITLTINATDEESGVAGYSFDDGENWQTSNSKIYTQNTNGIKIKVKDNAGNITSYDQTIDIDKIDKTTPTITITPNGSSTSQNKDVTITVADVGGSGLSNNNSYQYQLGTSSTIVPTGTWQHYSSGTEFLIGEGLTGDYYLWVKTIVDKAGNESSESDYILSNKFTFDNSEDADTIAPELSVEYSTTQLTNKSVIATITANEQLQQLEGWAISEDGTTLTKIYTENIEKSIDVYDLAGNKSTIQVKITNIDKTEIEATVEYSTTILTNKNVTVKIILNKEIQEIEGWTLSEDKRTLTKEYTENSDKNVKLQDLVGNEREIKISVQNIDKLAPNIQVKYSITENTNEDVIVTIVSDEQLQELDGWTISEDGKILTKKYEKNSQETVKVYDLARNEIDVKITVNNIVQTTTQKKKENNSKNSDKPDTVPTRIPDAGSNTLIGVIIITIIVSIILWTKNRKFKDIK